MRTLNIHLRIILLYRLSVHGVIAITCINMMACRFEDDLASPDDVFTKTEVSTFNTFRSADTANRSSEGEKVKKAFWGVEERDVTKERITIDKIKSLLGAPSKIEIWDEGTHTRLLYRTYRRGGEEKFFAFIFVNDAYLGTESVSSIE